MLLRHQSGAVSTVECTYENRSIPGNGLETLLHVEGQEGAIALDRGFRLLLTSRGTSSERYAAPRHLAWAEPGLHVIQDSVVRTCAHVLAAFRDGRPAEISGRDNLKTFALVEAAYQAASEHCAVSPHKWHQRGNQ